METGIGSSRRCGVGRLNRFPRSVAAGADKTKSLVGAMLCARCEITIEGPVASSAVGVDQPAVSVVQDQEASSWAR